MYAETKWKFYENVIFQSLIRGSLCNNSMNNMKVIVILGKTKNITRLTIITVDLLEGIVPNTFLQKTGKKDLKWFLHGNKCLLVILHLI